MDLRGYNTIRVQLYSQLGQVWKPSNQDEQWQFNTALTGLGNAYNSLGDYPKAIEYHQQSLKIAREIGDRQGEANSLGNLGNAYNSLGDYPKAIEYYQQSLKIVRDIGSRQEEAISWFNLGETLAKLKQKSEAIAAYQNARELYQVMELEAQVQNCDAVLRNLSEKASPLSTVIKRIVSFIRQ